MSDEQYCSFCGRDLEVQKIPSTADEHVDLVYLSCPRWGGGFWGWFFGRGRHRRYLTRTETSETILNYDPFTGERIKRDSKRIS